MDKKWWFVTLGAAFITFSLILTTGLDILILQTIVEIQGLPRYSDTVTKYLWITGIFEALVLGLGLFFAFYGGLAIVWSKMVQQKK